MSWIAIASEETRWIDTQAFAEALELPGRLLTRGTLLIETRIDPRAEPKTLLAYERGFPLSASLTLQVLPDGNIILAASRGGEIFHTVIAHPEDGRPETLRLSLSWDADRTWARLAVERPDTDGSQLREVQALPPPFYEDVKAVILHPQLRHTAPDLLFFAVSDEIEPVGPLPTLSGTIPIDTAQGPRRLDRLGSGAEVRIRGGKTLPVLQTVARTLPAFGSFRPVRLRAPYLGLTRDILVAPHQRLLISGSEVEYLFGREAVLVPAQSLTHGFAAHFEPCGPLIRYHQLLLPAHDALCAAGLAAESLYIGRLRRDPARLGASVLAGTDRRALPEHHRAGHPLLRPFEAVTLVEARAA
ncbi:Hint domain-containing protein [Salipiger mangrovisoli]|uniref:Hint domain-containing protein n=1 Tax=Salipiger mangrovisoli TaxID=2865933 RepID=A0ABR9WXW1_9RHOB|nr:Hint domain-containing protein [Salipiger mangrovisoli]MBE9636132.1 Hint domain-containing protein [Salipiger mangrovisoli]